MITAIVQFKVPDGVTRAQAFANMNKAAPRFENVTGLIRKTFIFDADSGTGGGVYTWDSRDIAEAFYAEGGAWRDNIRNLYGVEPAIRYFDTPVVVDNAAGETQSAA